MKLSLVAALLALASLAAAACSAPPEGQPSDSEGSAITLLPPGGYKIVGPVLNLSGVGPDGGFRVCNAGQGASPAFRIAVVAGANSYSIEAGVIAAGTCEEFTLSASVENCGNAILILVDPQGDVAEYPTHGNHETSTYGYCNF